MDNFRNFFKNNQAPSIKWDVVLFTGDYNPITITEHFRIYDFVHKYIKGNKDKFDNNTLIGLLSPLSKNKEVKSKIDYELTFKEKNYITTKFFGLRMFPIDFINLFLLSKTKNEEKLKQNIEQTSKFFKDTFSDSNILIVLRPDESVFLDDVSEICNIFSHNGINIGFISFKESNVIKDELLKDITIDGDIIKSVILLDNDKPSAIDLKSFAYKYKLQDKLEQIKRIHFLSNNNDYLIFFKLLFPNVIINKHEDNQNNSNISVVMDIIKNMYILK